MGFYMKLTLLVACMCILQASGYDDEDEYKRALQALRLLQREPEQQEQHARAQEERTCKSLGEGCRGMPRCCDTLQCYWEKGASLLKDGVCVECVQRDGKCQRNEQCCAGLQCDKGNVLWLDGNCIPPKPSGAGCYRNSQCINDCETGWWAFAGHCV